MNNPLDKFRPKTGEAPQDADEDVISPEEDKVYRAYRASTKPRRLIIRPRGEAHRAPAYSYLVEVMWDAEQGEAVGLVFSHAAITLRGRNLQDLAQLLASEKVGFVTEYDPKKWPQKPPAGEPIIESIKVTTKVMAPFEGEGKKET